MPTDLTIENLKIKIQKAQEAWAKGVVAIGEVFDDKEKYTKKADVMLDELYDFDYQGFMLFKPTIAVKVPVRVSKAQTLSYFIGGPWDTKEGGPGIDRNPGFALEPYEKVVFSQDFFFMTLASGELLVMGQCTFKSKSDELNAWTETTADYTFGYRLADDGQLRIFLHHSSVPFSS